MSMCCNTHTLQPQQRPTGGVQPCLAESVTVRHQHWHLAEGELGALRLISVELRHAVTAALLHSEGVAEVCGGKGLLVVSSHGKKEAGGAAFKALAADNEEDAGSLTQHGGYEHADVPAGWTNLSEAGQVEVLQPDGGGGGSGDDDGGCVHDGQGVGAVSAAGWRGGGGGMV